MRRSFSVAEQLRSLAASAEEDWDAAAKRRVDFPRLTAVRKCEDEALKAKMQGVERLQKDRQGL